MPAKGSEFERKISKVLSLWWTEGERDDVFWRTSQSGGRATIRKRKGKSTANQDGDICATDPIGQPLVENTTIELKKGYNAWSINELIDSDKKGKKLEDFIRQCLRESEGQNKRHWWLISRQDRRETLIFINHESYRFIAERQGLKDLNGMVQVAISHPEFGRVHGFNFDRFLEVVNPNIYKVAGHENQTTPQANNN